MRMVVVLALIHGSTCCAADSSSSCVAPNGRAVLSSQAVSMRFRVSNIDASHK